MQSEDWAPRADRLVARFADAVREHVPAEVFARGYFSPRSREGAERVLPLPRIAIGVLPVRPGIFGTRHEVVDAAKQAAQLALARPGSNVAVDPQYGSAYPQSLLFDAS